MKSNFTAFRFRLGRQRLHELFDFAKDVDDGFLVNVQPSRQSPLQFRKLFLRGQFSATRLLLRLVDIDTRDFMALKPNPFPTTPSDAVKY